MQKNYYPYIDGLRGIAVLSILLFHLSPSLLRGGFVGVDIFFVISGFLITKIIIENLQKGTFSFVDFYAHRIRRIFPALFIMLLVASLAAIIFLGPTPFYDFFKALRFSSFQASNILFAKEVDYFKINAAPSPLLHTWSLGVESQFYLIWPILLIVGYRCFGPRSFLIIMILTIIVGTVVSEILIQTNAKLAFYSLFSRAFELALGGFVSIQQKNQVRPKTYIFLGWLGFCVVIYSLIFSRETHFPGLNAIPPCLGTALIIYAGQNNPTNLHRYLSHGVITFFGLISYSLYLWHWPVIAFYRSYFDTNLMPVDIMGLALISILLALVSYKFIERPTRKTNLSSKKIIIFGIISIVFLIIFSNVIKRHEKSNWRVNGRFDEQTVTANPYYKLCAHEGGAYDTNNCIVGPNKDVYEVIITGDSHAAHFIPTVLGWAKSKGLTTRIFLRGNCGSFVEQPEPVIHQGKPDIYCMELTKNFYNILETNKTVQYVFTSLYLPVGNEALEKSFKKLNSFNKKVIYLGDAAVFAHNPIECEIQNNLLISTIYPRSEKKCLELDPSYIEKRFLESTETFQPLLEKFGIPYFDFRKYMKTPFDQEGHFLFMDDNHMNNYGGTFFIPALIELMEKYDSSE